jgi:hypothetical protein
MRGWSATVLAGVLVAGCRAEAPVLELALRSPRDPSLLEGVDSFVFSVDDAQGRPQDLRQFTGPPARFLLHEIPYGPQLTFRFEGLYRGFPTVLGQSCPTDVLADRPLPTVSVFVSRAGFFSTADDPGTARAAPLAFTGADGRLLIAGGTDGRALATAQSFDARTGRWRDEPSMTTPRSGGDRAAFGNKGEVLLVGGEGAPGEAVASAEVYDPARGFRVVNPQSGFGGAGARACTLSDGNVLVTGGEASPGSARGTVSLFDGQDLRVLGTLQIPRRAHTVTAGPLAAAFVIGGDTGAQGSELAEVELVNPNATSVAGAPTSGLSLVVTRLAQARAEHTATVLTTGEVLLVGGRGPNGSLDSAEIFDPTNRIAVDAGHLGTARRRHAATLLRDGRVLITGGVGGDDQPLRSAEVFDPARRTFAAARLLATARADHVAALLCDGTVLVVGGGPGAEIYNPSP